MNFTLSPDQAAVRALCREFADEVLAPQSAHDDKNREFPLRQIQEMGRLGLMGLMLPPEYGGSGAETVTYVAAMEEISRGDVVVGGTWGAHMTLGSSPFYLFGSREQKERYLAPLAKGEYLGAFGLTEPGAGSDGQSIVTAAEDHGDHWMVNGTKTFISNAGTPISYGLVALVVTGRNPDGSKQFSNLIIDKGTPGYTVGPNLDKMGFHAADTREQFFSDCRVPGENLLGERGSGFRQFMTVLDLGRIGFAATSLGLAQACLDEAIKYARQRVAFGRTISKFQLIQEKIARIATELEMVRLLTYKAAWLRDQGQSCTTEAAMAKWRAGELAMAAADEAVQIHGGYGYMEEYPVCRHFRNAKMLEIGEGTSEINLLLVARRLGC